MKNELVKFLSGECTDDRGRIVNDIVNWSDSQLESSHDYVQWVFPNRARSRFNPDAPTLDDDTISLIKKCPAALNNVRRMYIRIIKFYGFKIRTFDDGTYQLDLIDQARRPRWISRGNHNFLRLTRILLTLKDLGLDEEFFALADILEVLTRQFHDVIGEQTSKHWRDLAASLD